MEEAIKNLPQKRSKLKNKQEVIKHIKSGMTLMVGGFLSQGMAINLINTLSEHKTDNLTIITNDPGKPNEGIGKLIRNRQIKNLYASHVGMNPEVGSQVQEELLELHLVPQGTLVERIRCGGFGLGGILTPVGLGTKVAEGKSTFKVEDREYLVELPLKADVALIKAHKGDASGNLIYHGTSQNFNPMMAFAADLVIAEVDELVEVGDLDPNQVITPGVLIDFLVVRGD